MKKTVIITNPNKDRDFLQTNNVSKKLMSFGADVYIDKKYSKEVPNVKYYGEFPCDAEIIIVIGGDGSVIDASVYAVEHDIPILGVNLGKLGYLTEVEPDNTDILRRLFTGEYRIEERMLLSVSHISDRGVAPSTRFAVNDIIISHETFLGISDFMMENKNSECVKYRADGMIFSTPQGSTAYSLSAGGPIISHDIDSVLATPICPHSFFNRSIIFNRDEVLTVTNSGENPLNISIDGRWFMNMESGEKCVVRTAEKKIKVATFSESGMFSTLFKKMRILEDIK